MTTAELRALLERQREHDFALIDELTPDLAAALARLALAARAVREWGTVLADERIGYETVQVDVVDRIELDTALAAVFTGDDDE